MQTTNYLGNFTVSVISPCRLAALRLPDRLTYFSVSRKYKNEIAERLPKITKDHIGYVNISNIPEKNSHIRVVNILYAIIKPIIDIVISPVYFNIESICRLFNNVKLIYRKVICSLLRHHIICIGL